MKKIAFAALAPLALVALAGCAKTDDPNAQASADNVEMPAEEAMNSAEASAMPVEDKTAATEAAVPTKTLDEAKEAAAKTAADFDDLEKADAEPKE